MNLKLNTIYTPLTYDELVKPLIDYGKAYKEAEAEYSTLAAQAEAFKDEVNRDINGEAFTLYDKYSTDLNTAIEDFSNGMTVANRNKLLEMKRRYAGEILPIAKASEALKAANDFRDKAGPDAIFEVSRYNSLNDFLGGKTVNNRYQSASALTSKTAAITEAVMEEALQDPEFKKTLDNQRYIITQHTGGSYEDLMAAIANNPVAQNKFAEIKRQVMKDAGYENYDTYGKAAIENAVNTGLYVGLDKPVRQFEAYITPELQERQRQFNINLKTRGYDEEGNIDPSSPYWKLQGLEYDSATNTWKVVGKPGTVKPGGGASSGKSSSTRKPRLSGPRFIDSKGRVTSYDKDSEVPQEGVGISYSDMTDAEKNYVKTAIGDDFTGNYSFFRTDNEWFGNDAGIVIIPKKTVVNDGTSEEDEYAESFANG